LSLFRVRKVWFAGLGLEVRLQRYVKHFNDNRDRRNGNRPKLNLQTVGKGLNSSAKSGRDSLVPPKDRSGPYFTLDKLKYHNLKESLKHARPHATTSGRGFWKGRF
jgi:hypothetical protein